MASPAPNSDLTSTQPGRVFADLRWTSGSGGSVASVDPKKSYGFAATPAAHGATGVYTVTLADSYADFIKGDVKIKQASYSKTGACFGHVTAYDLAAKTVTILIVDAAGDATNPTTSDVVTVCLEMQTWLAGGA